MTPDVAGGVSDLPEYHPPPYLLPPSVPERVAGIWREVTQTPTRAAFGVLAVLSALIGAVALAPVTVRAVDGRGPYRLRCGLGYYVGGHPTAAIARACHHAYGAHAAIVFATAAVFVVSVAAVTALAVAARGGGPGHRLVAWVQRQWSTPGRAALLTFEVVAAVVAAASLRSVSVATVDAHGPLVAHCGITYYVFGTGDAPVQRACRAAYGGHAAVFFTAAGLFLLSVAGFRRLLRSRSVARSPEVLQAASTS